MLLFVKKLTGKKVPVEVQPEDTVDDLMCAVMCGGARLQFKGQPVEPSTPIAQIAGLKELDTFEVMGVKRLDYLTLVAPDGAKVQLEGSEVLVDKTVGTIKQEILEHKLKVPWFSIKLLNGTLELSNAVSLWECDLECGETLRIEIAEEAPKDEYSQKYWQAEHTFKHILY